jgi:hypothetical protein
MNGLYEKNCFISIKKYRAQSHRYHLNLIFDCSSEKQGLFLSAHMGWFF